jgi:hypothetical protein
MGSTQRGCRPTRKDHLPSQVWTTLRLSYSAIEVAKYPICVSPKFKKVRFNFANKTIQLMLEGAQYSSQVPLRIKQVAKSGNLGVTRPTKNFPIERDAYVISLGNKKKTIVNLEIGPQT